MVITNSGLNVLRDMLSGTAPNLNFIAIGTNSTVGAVDNTALGTEVNRVSAQSFRTYNTGIVNDVGVFTKRAEISSNNRNDFREVGLLSASSGGNLFNRIVTASNITHSAGRAIRIDVNYQVRKP